VRLPVEVIVAGGSAPTRAAQHATRSIPIVMNSGEPVGLEFVASLARPGGNITGMSNFSADLPGKQLELLKEVVPQSARVAVLTNPAHPSHGPEMAHLAVAAKALVERFVNSLQAIAAYVHIENMIEGAKRHDQYRRPFGKEITHANALCSPHHFIAKRSYRSANVGPSPFHAAITQFTCPHHRKGSGY